jgi:site-specific DNA recombinase
MRTPSKGGLYIRVSTDAQAEEGYSIDAQKEMLEAYCKTKGIKKYRFYIDGGFTGSNIDRPEIRRLIEDVKNGEVGVVIVYKLDRLSRSQKDTLYLIEDVFNKHKAEFISINENLDTSSPIGRAMLGIMSAFAQLERETIRERTRMGMKERVKTGLWMGGGRTPFGYDYDKERGVLTPNADAETVREIYDLYLRGFSTQKIADLVGLKYDKLALQILTRKTNVGVICYNGVEYAGKHEPIISVETYDKAMSALKERSVKRTVTSSHYLQGLVYCGKCGARMHYKKWGKAGYKLCCYSQQTSKKYLVKDPNCTNEKCWADDVEDIVINDLLSMSWGKAFQSDAAEGGASPLELMEIKYKQLTGKLKKLYNLYGDSGDDILLQTIEETKKDISVLQNDMDSEKQKHTATNKLEYTKEMLKDIAALWEHMTFMERQNIMRNALDKIVISDNNIEIYYNFIGKIKP